MARRDHRRSTRLRWLVGGAVVLVVLLAQIDDWGRDLTGSWAEIGPAAGSDDLRPFVTTHSLPVLAEAVRRAAARIPTWRLVGESRLDDGALTLLFAREGRILSLTDDIVVRLEDRGAQRVLTAESQARAKIGDLGRNPRNLRRLLAELRDVLDGASRDPAPLSEPTS